MAVYEGVSVEREIAGHTYEIRLLGLDQSEEVLVLLANMGGSALHSIAAEVSSGGSRGVQWEALAGIAAAGVGGVLSRLTAAQIKTLRTTFAGSCSVRLDPGGGFADLAQAQHTVFRGKLDVMIQWLIACIEVNFSGFFVDMQARITSAIELALRTAAKAYASESPEESIGDAGDS